MERANERIVFFTDPFIIMIIIITHFTAIVIVANHWNYVKSAFLFTWPPGWLPALPSPCLAFARLPVCMHIHLLYLFYLCKQVMRRTHKYTSTLCTRNTDMILNQITLFFLNLCEYLLEQTNTINEYKRKQIELIFLVNMRATHGVQITCASNYILHYITGTHTQIDVKIPIF